MKEGERVKVTSSTGRPARCNPPLANSLPARQHPEPGFFDSVTGRYEGVQLFPPIMLPMYGAPPIMPPSPAAAVSKPCSVSKPEAPDAPAGWFRSLVERFRRFMQKALQEVFQWPEGW